MSLIDEALSANATIANDYDPGRGKPPAPKIAIVTCADPRLTSIEQMLGLAAADVDMIRNFGTWPRSCGRQRCRNAVVRGSKG